MSAEENLYYLKDGDFSDDDYFESVGEPNDGYNERKAKEGQKMKTNTITTSLLGREALPTFNPTMRPLSLRLERWFGLADRGGSGHPSMPGHSEITAYGDKIKWQFFIRSNLVDSRGILPATIVCVIVTDEGEARYVLESAAGELQTFSEDQIKLVPAKGGK